jgi:hypothetical protein
MGERLSKIRSFGEGVLATLVFTNLSGGKGSLGDDILRKIGDRHFSEDGKRRYEKDTFYLGAGTVLGFASEVAVPAYLIATTDLKWYAVLGADLAIKTIPRLVDWAIRTTMREEEIHYKRSVSKYGARSDIIDGARRGSSIEDIEMEDSS